MADSMQRLVGLAGTSLANRRMGNAQAVSTTSIAKPRRPECTGLGSPGGVRTA
jgi:hypothetical protein